MRFRDRTDAGERLARELADREIRADVVLAIPRGGLPLGRAVADELGAPLDVLVASKIGAPDNPEYAIGAAASDGTVWRNDHAIEQLGLEDAYVERAGREAAEAAREKATRYREGDPEPSLAGKRVVIVDDGVATGSTARACVELARAAGAERVVLAVPVGPPDSVGTLRDVADEVVCLTEPPTFGAVGQFYERFDQVSDEAAIDYLGR
jgi:predicted phosphoribosyltransferase